jgi:hypothetical protein
VCAALLCTALLLAAFIQPFASHRCCAAAGMHSRFILFVFHHHCISAQHSRTVLSLFYGIANCKPSTTMPSKQKKAKISVAKQSTQVTLDGSLALLPPSKKRRVKKRLPPELFQFPSPEVLVENNVRNQSMAWLNHHKFDWFSPHEPDAHPLCLSCPFECGRTCLAGVDEVLRHLQSDGHPIMHHRVFEQAMKDYKYAMELLQYP